MVLRIVGGTIFGIIILVTLIIGFKFWLKEQKSIKAIMPTLIELTKIAEDRFNDNDLIGKKFIDHKVYKYSDIEKIDYKFLFKVNSQYKNFAITIKSIDDSSLGIIPFLVSSKIYNNIYIFIKEFYAYYQNYLEIKNYDQDFCNSFNLLIEYMQEYQLSINDLYFGPIADINADAALNYSMQHCFNLKKDPQDFAKFSKINQKIKLLELNKYDYLEEHDQSIKILNKLVDAQTVALFQENEFFNSTKMCVLTFGKFEKKFLLNIQIFQSEFIQELLTETNIKVFVTALENFDLKLLTNKYQKMTTTLLYMVANDLTINDVHILEINDKLIKKILKNRILMNRTLNN